MPSKDLLDSLLPQPNAKHRDLQAQAKGIAAELAKDEALTTEIEALITRDHENKLSVVKLHFQLEDTLAGIGMEKVQSWPVPDTIQGHVGDNVAYDWYRYKDTDGNIKTASFWNLVREEHPVIVKHRAVLKRLADDKDMHDEDKAAPKRVAQNAISAFNGRFRDALLLFFKMSEANDAFLSTGILSVTYAERVVMEKGKPKVEKGKVVTERDDERQDCILVTDLVSKKVKSFTIPNFLRLNVDVAKAKGGTYGDFIKSNARTPGGGEGEGTFKMDGPEGFEGGTATTLNYLNGAITDDAHWRRLVAHYNAAGSDDRLQTLVNLRDTIDKLLNVKPIKARVDAWMAGAEKDAA